MKSDAFGNVTLRRIVRLGRIGYAVTKGKMGEKGMRLHALAKFICGAAIAASVSAVAAPRGQISVGKQVVDARGAALGVVTSVERASVILNTGTHQVRLPHSDLSSREGKLVLGVHPDQVEQYFATNRIETSAEWYSPQTQ